METLKEFPLLDKINNWVVNYLAGRSQCTKFVGTLSTLLEINASFFQGSGFGPVAFIFNNSKLCLAINGDSLDNKNLYRLELGLPMPISDFKFLSEEEIDQLDILLVLQNDDTKSF